jgi:hypothetical protein
MIGALIFFVDNLAVSRRPLRHDAKLLKRNAGLCVRARTKSSVRRFERDVNNSARIMALL